MKLLVILILLAMLGALGYSMYVMFLGDKNTSMAKGLAFRVGFAILAILVIFIGLAMGSFKPNAPWDNYETQAAEDVALPTPEEPTQKTP